MNSLEYKKIIADAGECGLIFTGELEDDTPQFIGADKAWKTFDNSNN